VKATDRLHLVEGLLVAILDIDEVIQLIRASDNPEMARERLIGVFDLTEVQVNYILDMPLRRLTRFSTLELQTERGELQRSIEELTAILDDEALLRRVVSDDLSAMAKQHGDARRTILLESAGPTAVSATPLEVADNPCFVLLSSAGLLARTTSDEPPGVGGARARHDLIVATAATTARGAIGVVSSAGRLIRLDVIDIPVVPPTANAPHLQGGSPVSEYVALEPCERVLTLTALGEASAGLALGTAKGVVKRVQPVVLSNKDSWDVIRLDADDTVVGALELPSPDGELVFVTSDAQLLHFPASAVRPQGRSGGGIAGVRMANGARVVFFGAVDPAGDNVLITVAGSSDALPGTEPGSVKVTPLSEYPGKGRGTGGVRCHRFARGEDVLLGAYAGQAPARAAASSGEPIDLPSEFGRRDGSGIPAAQPLAAICGRLRG
ncbi:MAG: DNA gyrase subunit A, partial [Nocardioidaceae bacterium]